MKRLIYSMFIAFLASVATIAILARLSPPPAGPGAAEERGISAEELSRHSSPGDCWMAIAGGVYALSGYIPSHPAPEKAMAVWCGKDATEAFNTKGLGRPHSPAARALLPSYRIGSMRPRPSSR
ncbi:MAG: cytochrome b5-like heme/steroid binding domain-containing protein [Elusimicrobia bacterium]|nr:cytochrome b5-like heme/steroid binding domain-containing protein [Elusimicrobiota bacterium]